MDFIDNVVPIFFLIFWVLAAIIGKKNKENKGSKSPAKSTIIGKIKEAAEAVAREMETSSTEFSIDSLKADKFEQSTYSEEVELEDDYTLAEEKTHRRSIVIPKPSKTTVSEKRKEKTKYSADELKKAIVWSEIMAPPIAMRD